MIKFNKENIGNITRDTSWYKVYKTQHGRTSYEVRTMLVHNGKQVIALFNIQDLSDIYRGIETDKLVLKRKIDLSSKLYLIRDYESEKGPTNLKCATLVIHKDLLEDFRIEGEYKDTSIGFSVRLFATFNGESLPFHYYSETDLKKAKSYVEQQLKDVIQEVENSSSKDELNQVIKDMRIWTV